ncbi:MAG TPA: SRPBCC family protein [Gemmataceae bacterium]|nr:SRPBCC family protein [Gemmataceae bacterium]
MTNTTMQAPTRRVHDSGAEAGRPWINVGQGERWASALGGGLLAAYGLLRRDLRGLALAAFGGALLYRGATGHCGCYSALGLSTAGRGPATGVPAGAGMRVEASIEVNRQPSDLYLYWRNFENMPRFMRHLRSVKVDGNRSRWTTETPLGACISWEAEIINDKEGELIAWRSLPGSHVDTAGSVHFRRASGGQATEVVVEMKYNPPAGRAGAALAWIFGDDAKRQVEDSLLAFKRLMEQGQRAAGDGRHVSRFAERS